MKKITPLLFVIAILSSCQSNVFISKARYNKLNKVAVETTETEYAEVNKQTKKAVFASKEEPESVSNTFTTKAKTNTLSVQNEILPEIKEKTKTSSPQKTAAKKFRTIQIKKAKTSTHDKKSEFPWYFLLWFLLIVGAVLLLSLFIENLGILLVIGLLLLLFYFLAFYLFM